MKKNEAFTLIELVICIGIILLLLSIGGLNFKIRDRVQAREQVKELALDLKFLKNYSQINNIRTSMNLSDEGYSINFGDNTKTVKFNSLVNLESTNLEKITFSNKGKPSYLEEKSSAGTINFSVVNKKYKITIQPVTGKVNFIEIKE
ncbi:prepilin-type cleavage/methylation protein [Peptoniphilus harei]|uniref:Prepilin-type cleavage/methylation protein n=1 Tax=Peptoniphilus harei TaxID=54005 RepID=A0A133PP18_9FIRM|nr:prepilin-type N-terminal cleavage/methylation domain-containing protein [Peptoniphilus harei]KXA30381.1 prepilin-type cleavage/methylation protein [Peptoniphilus harei]